MKLKLSLLCAVLLLSARGAVGQISDLQLRQPTTAEMASSADVHYYRIAPAMAAGQHLIVSLERPSQEGCPCWANGCIALRVRYGGISQPEVGTVSGDCNDQVAEVLATEQGNYYLEVYAVGEFPTTFPRAYTITALTPDMLPTPTLGVGQVGELEGLQDRRFYRIPESALGAGRHLIVEMDKSSVDGAGIWIRHGGVNEPEVASASGSSDLAAEVINTEAGDYYVEVGGGVGTYTMTALMPDMLPQLALGVAQTGQLEGPQDRMFYRLTAAEAQHLLSFLERPSQEGCPCWANGCIALRVRYGGIGQPEVGTVSGDCNDQVAEVLATEQGDHYLEVYAVGEFPTTFPRAYTITALTPDMLPTLTLGVGQVGRLDGPQDRKFYRIPGLPADQHLMGFLHKEAPWGGCLTLHYGQVTGDPLISVCDSADLAVEEIPTRAGDYYLEISGSGSDTYTVSAVTDEIPFTVRSVSPSQPGNIGGVTITVYGSGFRSGSAVTACPAGQQTGCKAATDVFVASQSELRARFDFGGAPAGSDWDLFVTDPDQNQRVLPNALRLATPRASVWAHIVAPDRVLAGRQTDYTVEFGNEGNVDIYDRLLLLSLPPGAEVSCLNMRHEEVPPLEWCQVPAAYDTDHGMEVPIWMVSLPAGADDVLGVSVTMPWEPLGEIMHFKVILVTPPQSEYSRTGNRDVIDTSPIFQAVVDDTMQAATQLAADLGVPPPSRDAVADQLRDFGMHIGQDLLPGPKGTAIVGIGGRIGKLLKDIFGGGLTLPWPIGNGLAAGHIAGGMMGASIDILGDAAGALAGSMDPNEKEGPSGFAPGGREGEWTGACPPDSAVDKGWVSSGHSLPYVVRFENLAAANADAENIIITDVLDPSLEWSTLEVGESRIGGVVYYPTVTLNPDLRTICWTFTGVNLPPNCDDPGRPECQGIGKGEGSVSFSVRPVSGVATGTVILNHATIVFDVNQPMCTSEVINTVDADIPSSQVAGLPAESASPFSVAWAGNDGPDGTGVKDYTIYVSDNGGPYQPWLIATTDTSAPYLGELGHTYSFHSAARDNVGNVEAAPESADATTTVMSIIHIVSASASADPLVVPSQGVTQLAAEADDTQGHGIAAWSWSDGSAGGMFSPNGNSQSPTYTAPGNTSGDDLQIVLSVAATCDGASPLAGQSSISLTVTWDYDHDGLPDEWEIAHGLDVYDPADAVADSDNDGLTSTAEYLYDTDPSERDTDGDGFGDGEELSLGSDPADPGSTPQVGHFVDVPVAHWAFHEIEAAYRASLVAGYPDGTYQPTLPVTRDQMAVYIARAIAGGDGDVPDPGCMTPPFPDVPCDHWARKHIQYAVANGVVQGYPEGDYKPDLEVTRDQMAVYVARAMVAPAGDAGVPDPGCTTPPFPDVPCDHWATRHIQYCVSEGVVTGYDDGLYHPEWVVTRDQMAVYICRAFQLPM
jgi:hypothetical protein